jgi:hypothetical protein
MRLLGSFGIHNHRLSQRGEAIQVRDLIEI